MHSSSSNRYFHQVLTYGLVMNDIMQKSLQSAQLYNNVFHVENPATVGSSRTLQSPNDCSEMINKKT